MIYDVDDAIRTMIRRGTLTKVDDRGSQQLVEARGFGGETFEDCYRPQAHGISSVPPVGSEGLLLALGGRADRTLMLGFEHKDSRIKDQKPGWTSLYDDKGNVVSLVGSGGMKVKAKEGKITVEPGAGQNVFLGGDGSGGGYQRVRTESGLSVNIYARVG